MSLFSAFRRPPDAPADPFVDRTMHTADPAYVTPLPDHGTEIGFAEQRASDDVSSGAVDATSIAAGQGPLPFDEGVEARRSRAVTDNAIERMKARVIAASNKQQAWLGRNVTAARRAPDPMLSGSLPDTLSSLSRIRGERAEAIVRARSSAAVLNGEHPDVSGASWSGTPIPVQRNRYHRARVLHRAIEFAPLVGALLVEGFVTSSNLYAVFRTPDLVQSTAIALAVLFTLTFGPYFAARALSERRARGRFGPTGALPVFLGAGFWFAIGVSLAIIRTIADTDARAADAADRATDSGFVSRPGAGALPTPAPTSASVADSAVTGGVPFLIELLFWLVALLGMGVVVFLWEFMHRNPIRLVELEDRERVHLLTEDERALRERANAIAADLAFQDHTARDIDGTFETREFALLAQAAEVKNSYRAQLARVSGDPEMANAIQLRDRSTAPAVSDAVSGIPRPDAFVPLVVSSPVELDEGSGADDLVEEARPAYASTADHG